MKFRIARKIKYLKKARHRHGHGIHSPWLFGLITNVIENKKRLPEYKILREQRERLSHFVKEHQAELGLQTFSETVLKSSGPRNLFKAVELPFKYGKLLLRLVNEFKPRSISFIGPTFGLNLLYLALSKERVLVEFFQSGEYMMRICMETLEYADIRNLRYRDEENPLEVYHDFVFINSPFNPELVERLTGEKIASGSDYEVMIIRGIHDSQRMETVWQDFIRHSRVRVSLDLFEIGIAIFSVRLQKENFVLKF
jgi:hypothetical protein